MQTQRAEYDYHLPVLLNESIEYLFNNNVTDNTNQIYIDGTLGGGGHAAIILQNLNFGGKLFAFDKDTSAIERASNVLEEYINTPSPSLYLCNNSFAIAKNILAQQGIYAIDGVLFDLGVSSKQLDSEQRGISYRVNCPIDMRFDAEQNPYKPSAKDIINIYTEKQLSDIFFKYGEEPHSRFFAKKIIEARNIRPIETTYDLKTIIEEYTPKLLHFKTLSRIFQAIRIEVNNELGELENALNNIIPIIKQGGRIVVISYHSIEDGIVKNIFKKKSFTPKVNKYKTNKLTNNNTIIMPKLKILTRKPITPSKVELLFNPRSRSAKMRVAEKL
jgi:16S rRNA (cytosine1402-N4)-methyltransferase